MNENFNGFEIYSVSSDRGFNQLTKKSTEDLISWDGGERYYGGWHSRLAYIGDTTYSLFGGVITAFDEDYNNVGNVVLK